MIYLFPNLDTLRIALTSGQIPADVSREHVEAAFLPDGSASIKPHAIPPKPMQNALKRLGIKSVDAHIGEPTALASWLQILPVARAAGTPEFTSTNPVLFELPVERFSSLVTEMLRLGNDRQSYRVLSADKEADQRVLLRVIGPPYYTLLRALDRLNADITAYLEQFPRVWIEMGCSHPLAGQMKVPDGRILLLRAARDWKSLEDGPYQDVYDVLDFQVPNNPSAFAEGKLKGKLTVPLRLAAGNAAEVPEMWVLREDALEIFDAFVRDADDRLMNRLMFAVAENGASGPVIVLRTRTSKLSPPAIELTGALGYLPFRRLNNLFLPVGTRLQPTLRRDAVRKMLAEDDAQIVWLASLGDGSFVPESLPDAAFRPLSDWVEYVIDHQRQPLQKWIEATRFEFDDFICKDEAPIAPPKPPGSARAKSRKPGERPDKIDTDDATDAADTKEKKKSRSKDEDAYVAPQAPAKPDELKIKRAELERAFLAIDGPLDAPERLALWPQLAQLNAALGEHSEAAICWLNGIWELDAIPASAARAWLEGEEAAPRKTLKIGELDRLLAVATPLKTDLRRIAAILLFASTHESAAAAVQERLPAVRAYLDKHDGGLPVRAVWLVWTNLARLSGDVLCLARVRDRLLDRLMEKRGLDLGLDAPTFVDLADNEDGERIRQMRDRAIRLHRAAQQWHDRSIAAAKDHNASPAVNKPFVDLVFAFGMAVLGQETVARDLVQSAARVLLTRTRPHEPSKPDEVGAFLHKALLFRIERALNKEAHEGPLPADMLKRIEEIDVAHRQASGPSTERYAIDRFREHSWILEPNERFDPYGPWKAKQDWIAEIAELGKERDPKKLEEKIRRLLRQGSGRGRVSPEQRLIVLHEAVSCAWRVGRDFAIELVLLVPSVLDSLKTRPADSNADIERDLRHKQAGLLERAIYLAGHYGDRDAVQKLFQRFLVFVRDRSGPDMHDAINQIARECLRNLRKVGLQDEISEFLRQITELVIQGQSLSQIRVRSGKNWPDVLGTLIHLAEGWLFNRNSDQAQPFLDEARTVLFAKGKDKISPQSFARLARSYVCALAQGPVDEALTRIEEMFQNMAELPNTFTSAPWYSRLHLQIVEEVVRAMVSDSFKLSETARRYLDDDEFLVRRRIHGDMRKLLAQSGL
jgi:FtsH ternary system domain X7